MYRVFQALRPFIRGAVRHAPWVLTVALLFSVLGLYLATNLRIDADLSNLVPKDYPSVQALEQLRQEVGGESDVAVVIQSPSFEAQQAFAEALIPRALDMQWPDTGEPYLSRVEYRRDTDFLERNALYFATDEELDDVTWYLEDLMEQARLQANPFFVDVEEDDDELEERARELDEAYDRIVGQEFPVSPDSTILVVRFYPTGAQTDIEFIDDLYTDLERLVAEMEPAGFHPEMEVTLAGRMLRQLVEVETITNDVIRSFGAGIGAVLLFVTLYFMYKSYRARVGMSFSRRTLRASLLRAPILALLIGIPLLMSLTWTFGVAYLTYQTLNLMTSALGLVLFGLGIDYGIHFYGRYTEERSEGASVVDAAEITFSSTGQAITVGALTTAAALYVLVAADFRGFSEFGFIAGTGVLFALIAMTIVMPALLAVFEGSGLLNFAASEDYAAEADDESRFPAARGVLLVCIAAVVLAVVMLPGVGFNYDFAELEPEYVEYLERHELVREVFPADGRRNPAYILVESPEESEAVVEAVERERMVRGPESTVLEVESLHQRFPMLPGAQQQRLERIAEIRDLLDDRYLQEETDENLERLRRAAQTTEPIGVDQVPDALRQQFQRRDGEIGHFVMIYPSVGLSDGRNSIAFSDEIGTVVTEDGRIHHAGSTSLVAADMLRLLQAEAPWMILATFVIVFLLMWLNFGALRWAMLALLPLVAGVMWMLLVMSVFNIQLNFYNLVVLPAVLGIGNDVGAHLAHRYREEGPGSIMRVLRSTGEHVTIGALTTMIGFSGLLLSFHPGLSSIGLLAVVGIGVTLLSGLLFFPALIQWLEDRHDQIHHEDDPVMLESNGAPDLVPHNGEPPRQEQTTVGE